MSGCISCDCSGPEIGNLIDAAMTVPATESHQTVPKVLKRRTG
jgi:hypothetical protein